MQRRTRTGVALALVVMSAPAAACGHSKNEQSSAGNVAPPPSSQPAAVPGAAYGEPAAGVDTSTTKKPKHHSKLAGAAVGAAAGHMVGHPIAGAVAGAIVQHERNKHKK